MDINEVISVLKEDYTLRKNLMRKQLSVHDELEDEIENLEQSYITSFAMPKIEAYAKELLKELECEAVIVVKKDVDGNVAVSDDMNCDLVRTEPNPPLTSLITTSTTYKKPYNPEAELVVEFPDGTIFDDKKAIQTFVCAIEKIGFEKVAKVGIEIMGYNLVDTRQRTDKGRTWQKHVGNYFIYSYLSNGEKIKYLNQISNYYNLGLKILTQ